MFLFWVAFFPFSRSASNGGGGFHDSEYVFLSIFTIDSCWFHCIPASDLPTDDLISCFPILICSRFAAIGFNVETVQYNNIKFQVWDLGTFFHNVKMLVYVIKLRIWVARIVFDVQIIEIHCISIRLILDQSVFLWIRLVFFNVD